MRAVLVDSSNNRVMAVLDDLKTYNTRQGEITFNDKARGNVTISNVDFSKYSVKGLTSSLEPIIGETIPNQVLQTAEQFRDVTTEDYIESLQIEAANTLMQLSLARMDMNASNAELHNTKMALAGATQAVTTATDEVIQVRQEVASLMMLLTMKGGE